MIDQKTAPYAALVLRLGLGVMLVAHNLWLKLFVFTLPGTAQSFKSPGLRLTKSLVELHGGSLELESKLGAGTTATVVLPARRIVRPSKRAEPAHGATRAAA